MKNELTELVFILDRSGSMGGLESDTIGGFNGLLAKQKKEEGRAHVTTVLFDDKVEVLHDRFDLEDVEPITDNDYYVRGCTALYDAIGQTVSRLANVQKRLPDEKKADKVIIVITTDGFENASKEYGAKEVKKLVKKMEEKHKWQFMFLGANMDAMAEAEKFGIRKERAVSFHNDSKGVGVNFKAVGAAMACLRKADFSNKEEMCDFDTAWKADIEADFEGRR